MKSTRSASPPSLETGGKPSQASRRWVLYDSKPMGRAKSRFTDLPPRMTARDGAAGLLYYYQAAGKKIPLGSDLPAALQEWAKLEVGNMAPKLFPEMTKLYRKAVFE